MTYSKEQVKTAISRTLHYMQFPDCAGRNLVKLSDIMLDCATHTLYKNLTEETKEFWQTTMILIYNVIKEKREIIQLTENQTKHIQKRINDLAIIFEEA